MAPTTINTTILAAGAATFTYPITIHPNIAITTIMTLPLPSVSGNTYTSKFNSNIVRSEPTTSQREPNSKVFMDVLYAAPSPPNTGTTLEFGIRPSEQLVFKFISSHTHVMTSDDLLALPLNSHLYHTYS